jgi:hypothetical protein
MLQACECKHHYQPSWLKTSIKAHYTVALTIYIFLVLCCAFLLCAAATDLLTDDYGLKRTLKVKHTTPQGVTFTVENEHKKGNVVGKITGKYVHKESGFALDKITLAPDGSKSVECALVNLADGLRLTAKVSSRNCSFAYKRTYCKHSACFSLNNSFTRSPATAAPSHSANVHVVERPCQAFPQSVLLL